jgi:type VI secretion system protein ImpF
MPAPDSTTRLLPSLIDRLIDPDTMGGSSMPGYDHRQMLDAVRADLEDLLNTRQALDELPAEPEVARSIVAYGLPELSLVNSAVASDVAALARTVAAVITRYEPRLKNVRVTLIPGGQHPSRSVRLQIEAQLNVNPAPTIGLETVLELTSGHAVITPREIGA